MAMLAAVTATETTGKPGTRSGCALSAGWGAVTTFMWQKFPY